MNIALPSWQQFAIVLAGLASGGLTALLLA
jgi:hypothetical protein